MFVEVLHLLALQKQNRDKTCILYKKNDDLSDRHTSKYPPSNTADSHFRGFEPWLSWGWAKAESHTLVPSCNDTPTD